MELAVLAGGETPMKKKNVKMHLDSLSIEAADNGGYIVRCSYEGGGGNCIGRYESKTKVFATSEKLAAFIPSALEELGVDMDDEDED